MTISQTQAFPSQSERADHSAPLIIRTQKLSKKFGEQYAVKDLSFQLPRGAIFGFIGPSGSGKTTTVRLLTGIYKPSEGEARVLDHDPTLFRRRDRERIGYLPQLFVLYPDLSVQENMSFAASIYGVGFRTRRRRIRQLLEFVELWDDRSKLVKHTSGGMQRRLSLAATLIHSPELLFLDEPTAGIDPVLRRKFWDYFQELQDQGVTMFVTTQYVGEAAYCDYVGVMAEGSLLMVDTPEGLRRSAYGGEVINLQTKERVDFRHIQLLRQLPFVIGDLVRINENYLRITVDEASTAMPALIEWAQQEGVTIESIDEFLPPFDDVFVKLIQRFSPNGQ
jgi:ABC-2 type transport system ATP-binding protein